MPTRPPDLFALLSVVARAADAHVLQALDAAGLPGLGGPHGHVLRRLLDGRPTVAELAQELATTPQAVSRTVRELVERGYVERGPAAGDRRRRPLRLTELGRRAVAVAEQVRGQLDDEVGRRAASGDVRAAVDVLVLAAEVLGDGGPAGRRRLPSPRG